MSRSTKDLVTEPSDNPGVEKAGARRRPTLKPRSSAAGFLLAQRRSFGWCEKVLRRNRKLWTRLFAKEGRRLDKIAVHEELEES